MKKNLSWGNLPIDKDIEIIDYDKKFFNKSELKILTHGNGRSYGDVGLNSRLLSLDNHKKFLKVDKKNSLLKCSSNLTVKEVLNEIVPKGYFLPVVPGTQNITIGGAIANDIHGKNHHTSGSIGNFVKSIELHRSDIGMITCDENNNKSVFNSTIGGLGLTGTIISITIELKKINSIYMETVSKKFYSFKEFIELNNNFEKNYEYCVGWLDLVNLRKGSFRGVLLAGNHLNNETDKVNILKKSRQISFPLTLPFSLINKITIKILNSLYFAINKEKKSTKQTYRSFFFPLDIINNWNKAYGKNGFFQYQFVVPSKYAESFISKFIEILNENNQTPALTVLKKFGSIQSIGNLSFPREGVTLAIDFPNKGNSTLKFLQLLDKLVISHEGALYPAKDARMSKEIFEKSFPNKNIFKRDIDPLFSSFFWERVK